MSFSAPCLSVSKTCGHTLVKYRFNQRLSCVSVKNTVPKLTIIAMKNCFCNSTAEHRTGLQPSDTGSE